MMPSKVTTAPSSTVSTNASIAARSRTASVTRAKTATSAIVVAAAREVVDEMGKQLVEHGQPVAHPAGGAGQVDDDGPLRDTGGRAAESRGRGDSATGGPDGLGDAGKLLIEDGAGGFGGAVLWVD